jgi:hypothetical protein
MDEMWDKTYGVPGRDQVFATRERVGEAISEVV